MQLNHGLHLAYSTNVHRGESWAETFGALKRYTLAVRDHVCPQVPFAIGLRLSNRAANELSERDAPVGIPALARQEPMLRVHDERISLRPVSRRARQGTGLSPGLGFARTARLHQAAVRSAGANCCPKASRAASAPCLARSRNFIPTPEQKNLMRAQRLAHASSTSRTSANRPDASCTSAWNRNRSACSKAAPRRCTSWTSSAPSIRATNASTSISASIMTPAISPSNSRKPQNALASIVNHGIKISKIHLSSALKVRPTAGGAPGTEKICRRHLSAPGGRARRKWQPVTFTATCPMRLRTSQP